MAPSIGEMFMGCLVRDRSMDLAGVSFSVGADRNDHKSCWVCGRKREAKDFRN